MTKHKLLTNSLQPLSMNSRMSVFEEGDGTALVLGEVPVGDPGAAADDELRAVASFGAKVDGYGLISASRPWRSDSSRDRAWLRNLSQSSSAGSSSCSSSSTHSDKSLALEPPSL